jgi:hypothetical protein
MSSKLLWKEIALACALASAGGGSQADDYSPIEFFGSGFLGITVGKMLSGSSGRANDTECPCFISDYAQTGIYTGKKNLQWQPDSKLGLQGSMTFGNSPYSLTGQIVARGARDGEINLEWLYGNYKINEALTLQLGRKRLPMFFNSDAQDIGYALPWTHLPPQLYGWDVVNYNGANLTWNKPLNNGWHLTANLLAGAETVEESGYWQMYRGPNNRTDVKWDAILGGDINLSNDWLETRFVYIQSHTRQRNVTGSWKEALQAYDPATVDTAYAVHARQRIYGLAINVDRDDWLLKSEIIYIERPGDTFGDRAQILAIGRRIGNWQPMLTWSNYKTMTSVAGATEAHINLAATLRYELDDSSAVKVQLDQQHGRSVPGYEPQYGDARLLTLSYDRVF